MKRPLHTGRGKIVIYVITLLLFGMVAESCSGSKKCGCRGDLNSVYKPPKRYRY